MGDSESLVVKTSTVMDYTSTVMDYTSTVEISGLGSNLVPNDEALANVEVAGGGVASVVAIAVEGNDVDGNTVMQEAPVVAGESDDANAVVDSAQVVGYDASVNGNGVAVVGEYNVAGNDTNGNADASEVVIEQFEGDHDLSTEEGRLWSIVRANSLDFSAWTALIEETEKVAEENVSKIQKIYDAFLAEFPLCYGYWKKYADHEARLGSIEKVVEVYERAVGAVTYSVDIWLHYCVFAISTYGDQDTVRRQPMGASQNAAAKLLMLKAKMASFSAPFDGHNMVFLGRLFERGLAYVGTDYLSYPLWDKYIEYEFSQQEWCQLAMIYTRILENPSQQLDRYFNSFKELAGSRPLSELRTEEATAVESEVSGQEVEGEVHPDDAEHLIKPVGASLTEAEGLEKYIAVREEMYMKAKEFDSRIVVYEMAIRRPYFHVRPLNNSELENWHSYLDFIEREDDFSKVVKLYERCLIACANYSEYWIRYVLCMEASGSMDLANNALARATQVFVKRQPEIHLFAARFKEQNGDILGSRDAYQLLHSGICPGLLEAVIKHANMEYRQGNKEDAFSSYEQAIATEKGKEQSQTLPMLFVQYSRFLYLVAGNVEKSRAVLEGAFEHVQLSRPLLEAFIHLESIQPVPRRVQYLDSLVEKFVTPNSDDSYTASTIDREELSSIFLEFLDLFGDAQSIKKANDRHAKQFICHKSTSESRKRNADDFLASDKAKVAKSASGIPSSTQSLMGAYPSAPSSWSTGYGQPQAWAQPPQAQTQQWNPAYAQQAGYSGYSGYGSTYSQPQVQAPVSAPQTTAYATYPSTYPSQPVQQQSFVQPAIAAASYTSALAPQQAAPVSQAYYGSYY